MNRSVRNPARISAFAGGVRRGFNIAAELVVFLAMLVFSAVAIVVLTIGAPLALAISALAGGGAKRRVRWRPARAA
ncbi:MAG: hypothetical protein ACE5FO_01035 [Parvularculaceae bacterium]